MQNIVSSKSNENRGSNSFSLKVHFNGDSRFSQGIEQVSIHNHFGEKVPSQKLENKKACPSVQEIEIYIGDSDHENLSSGS